MGYVNLIIGFRFRCNIATIHLQMLMLLCLDTIERGEWPLAEMDSLKYGVTDMDNGRKGK